MRFDSDVDTNPNGGRGWYFGDPVTLYSPRLGTITILNNASVLDGQRADSFHDIIDESPSPGVNWFGLDFPGNSSGVVALFNSPVYGDPDDPSAFPSTAPNAGSSFLFDGIQTSIGTFNSENDGTVTSARLGAPPAVIPVIPEPSFAVVFGSLVLALLARRWRH